MKMLKKTRSLCPVCFKDISAIIFERNNQVFMKKICPFHGKSEVLMEKDSWVYKNILEFQAEAKPRCHSTIINVTHRCNNNCRLCYLPARRIADKEFEEIKTDIKYAPGKEIRLSGGEPTLREDITEIIRFAANNGKKVTLLTNGILLSRLEFVKMLIDSGLNYVQLSYNSFDPDKLNRMERSGPEITEKKEQALENLEESGVRPTLSFTLIKGENSAELKDMLKFSISRPSIKKLRVRSATRVGRYEDNERLFLSDLLSLIGECLGRSRRILLTDSIMNNELQGFLGNRDNLQNCWARTRVFREKNGLKLLFDEFDIEKYRKSRFRRGYILYYLIRKRKAIITRNLFYKFIMRPNYRETIIDVRSWPDKYTLDIDTKNRCSTKQTTKDGMYIPFCYSLIMNERLNYL